MRELRPTCEWNQDLGSQDGKRRHWNVWNEFQHKVFECHIWMDRIGKIQANHLWWADHHWPGKPLSTWLTWWQSWRRQCHGRGWMDWWNFGFASASIIPIRRADPLRYISNLVRSGDNKMGQRNSCTCRSWLNRYVKDRSSKFQRSWWLWQRNWQTKTCA